MNAKMIRALLNAPGVNGRTGIPTVWKGKPGVGKSSVISAVVSGMGLHLETVLASLREPSDFLGLPIPTKDGSVKYAPPEWAKRAAEAGEAVVFFDEINTAPPAVQAALLRVLLEGVVGDLQLPPGVRFIAAMNSVEDAAGGWDLAPPLANRLCHLNWLHPSVEQWTHHVSTGGRGGASAGKGSSKVDPDAWHREHSQAIGEISGFLRAQPGLLHAQPKRNEPNVSGAWPSPRSWEMTSRAVAAARIEGLTNTEIDEVVAGCVGVKAATDFGAFREKEDLPNVEDLLLGKIKFKATAKRPDRSAAVISACTAYLSRYAEGPNAKEDTAKNIDKFKVYTSIGAQVADHSVDLLQGAMVVMVHCKSAGLDYKSDDNLKKIFGKLDKLLITD